MFYLVCCTSHPTFWSILFWRIIILTPGISKSNDRQCFTCPRDDLVKPIWRYTCQLLMQLYALCQQFLQFDNSLRYYSQWYHCSFYPWHNNSLCVSSSIIFQILVASLWLLMINSYHSKWPLNQLWKIQRFINICYKGSSLMLTFYFCYFNDDND